mmetsp:Transcript_34195/g.67323  ORF Transcript_34195/g.67323 Transcript_34195/m.67323 type:complete len:287 (+) Transcript_34195:280-1140(+)
MLQLHVLNFALPLHFLPFKGICQNVPLLDRATELVPQLLHWVLGTARARDIGLIAFGSLFTVTPMLSTGHDCEVLSLHACHSLVEFINSGFCHPLAFQGTNELVTQTLQILCVLVLQELAPLLCSLHHCLQLLYLFLSMPILLRESPKLFLGSVLCGVQRVHATTDFGGVICFLERHLLFDAVKSSTVIRQPILHGPIPVSVLPALSPSVFEVAHVTNRLSSTIAAHVACGITAVVSHRLFILFDACQTRRGPPKLAYFLIPRPQGGTRLYAEPKCCTPPPSSATG